VQRSLPEPTSPAPSGQPTTPSGRHDWIDWLKAVGICLVVAGHADFPDGVIRWIFAFHMPLFFVASGFLLPPGLFEKDSATGLARRLRKLLLAYLGFGLLGAGHYCLIQLHAQEGLDLGVLIRERLLSLAYASGTISGPLQLHPLVLWFFPALISALLLGFAVTRLLPSPLQGFLPLLLLLAGLLPLPALPWELETGLLASVFLLLGCALRRNAHWQAWLRRLSPWTAFLLLLLGSLLALLNGRTDFRSSQFAHAWLWLPSCLLLLAALCSLAWKLPPSSLARRLSDASLYIFPLHPLFFWGMDTLVLRLQPGLLQGGVTTWAYAAVKSLLTIAACLLAAGLFHSVVRLLNRGARRPHWPS
jgi:acyltransferase